VVDIEEVVEDPEETLPVLLGNVLVAANAVVLVAQPDAADDDEGQRRICEEFIHHGLHAYEGQRHDHDEGRVVCDGGVEV